MGTKITCIAADITTLEIDAIVNAANPALLGGGGVDGAIHRAAGPELLAACREIGGCPVGEARLTPAFALPVRFVIHAVGPIWQGGDHDEAAQLTACYRHSLKLAAENDARSIAFPSISTGTYGYPIELAAPVAVESVKAWLAEQRHHLNAVVFCCFSDSDLAIYRELLGDE